MPEPINANDDYGVTAGTTSDQSGALQSAIDAAQAAGAPLILESGTYRINDTLIVRQGKNGSGPRYELDFDANGAVLDFRGSNEYCIDVQPQCPLSQLGTANDDGSISLRNFTITGPYTGAGGVKIGRPGYHMYDFKRVNLLENVMFLELRGQAVEITNAAHFDMERVMHRSHNGGKGLYIQGRDNTFTGDITFNDCQWQGLDPNEPSLSLKAFASSGDYSECRGIRFNSNVFYGGNALIDAGDNGKIADVWFNDCAWDSQGTDNALTLLCQGGGVLNKIWVRDGYFVGFNAQAIRLQGYGSSDTSEIHIDGCAFGDTLEPVWVQDFDGFAVQHCSFYKTLSGSWACINIGTGCHGFKVSDNTGDQHRSSNFIIVTGPDTSGFQITDNMDWNSGGNVFTDQTGGVSKNVHDNVGL